MAEEQSELEMPGEETSPLNPTKGDHNDPLYAPARQKRDPLSIRCLYIISLLISSTGFSAGVWSYVVVRNAPFDDSLMSRRQRQSYEENFLGMQSILVFLGINVLWTTINLRLAYKGKQNDIWPINMLYDLLLWASLIGFGVLNDIEALLGREVCNGFGGQEDKYARCEKLAFELLVLQLVSINLGLLVAALHFILLVGRCCVQGQRNDIDRSRMLRLRIREEEDTLLQLVERRVQLLKEYEELEARSATGKALPTPPPRTGNHTMAGGYGDRSLLDEDLIDIEPSSHSNKTSNAVPE